MRDGPNVAALAAAHWARWEAGIYAREPEALDALHRLIEGMVKHQDRGTLDPTVRELEVLRLLTFGHTRQSASVHLGIGLETVKTHLTNVRLKLGARNKTHAVAIAIRRGLI